MKRTTSVLALMFSTLLFAGCSNDDEPRVGSDSGTTETDAGNVRVDSDPDALDTGQAPDASDSADTGARDMATDDAGNGDMRTADVGASDGGETDADPTAPSGTIVFPHRTSATYYDQVVVRGTGTGSTPIASVTVSGVDALSDDAFATWEAAIDLQPGLNTLTGEVVDDDGNTYALPDLLVTRITPLEQSAGTAWDRAGRWLYTADQGTYAIRRVQVDTGVVERVADLDDFVSTTWDRPPRDIALTSAADTLYVLSRDQAAARERGVWQYDLATDTWSALSTATAGTGPDWSSPWRITLDDADAKAYVFDSGQTHVVEVDLATGDRTILSSATIPDSDSNPLNRVTDLEFDATGDQILVADYGGTVFGIDAATGARTLIASAAQGTGPAPENATTLGIDDAGRRAFLFANTSPTQLLEVDLGTGDRRAIPATANTLVSVAYDTTDDALHVIEFNQDAAYSIDVPTGTRSLVASNAFPGPTYAGDSTTCSAANDEVWTMSPGAVSRMAADNTLDPVLQVGSELVGRLRYMTSTSSDTLYILSDATNGTTRIYVYDTTTGALATPVVRANTETPMIYDAEAFHVDDAGETAYVINEIASGHQLLEIDLATGDVAVVSDPTHISPAEFDTPTDLSLDGTTVIVADAGRLLSVDRQTGVRSVSSLPAPTGTQTVHRAADGAYWFAANAPELSLWTSEPGAAASTPISTPSTTLGYSQQPFQPYWIDSSGPFISCDGGGVAQFDPVTGRAVILVY